MDFTYIMCLKLKIFLFSKLSLFNQSKGDSGPWCRPYGDLVQLGHSIRPLARADH